MLVFGAAHVCLIFWLWGLSSPTWWSLALWVAVYILTAVLFRKELPTLGKLTAPFLLYPALLGGSLALAAPLPFTAGARWWPVALGCLLFYVSDMLVAKKPALPLARQMAEAHHGPVLGRPLPHQHRRVAALNKKIPPLSLSKGARGRARQENSSPRPPRTDPFRPGPAGPPPP